MQKKVIVTEERKKILKNAAIILNDIYYSTTEDALEEYAELKDICRAINVLEEFSEV